MEALETSLDEAFGIGKAAGIAGLGLAALGGGDFTPAYAQPAAQTEKDSKLPPEAQKVMAKYDATVDAAKKVYEAAVAKAKEQATKELKPIQQAEVRKGNLDTAMAIKAKLEELKAEELQSPTAPKSDVRVAPGEYPSKQGTFVISIKGDKISLQDKTHGHYSTGFKAENNRILFSWSNNDDLIVVEPLAPERISVTCYGGGSRGGIPKAIQEITGKVVWTCEAVAK